MTIGTRVRWKPSLHVLASWLSNSLFMAVNIIVYLLQASTISNWINWYCKNAVSIHSMFSVCLETLCSEIDQNWYFSFMWASYLICNAFSVRWKATLLTEEYVSEIRGGKEILSICMATKQIIDACIMEIFSLPMKCEEANSKQFPSIPPNKPCMIRMGREGERKTEKRMRRKSKSNFYVMRTNEKVTIWSRLFRRRFPQRPSCWPTPKIREIRFGCCFYFFILFQLCSRK